MPDNNDYKILEDGLDFILSHFQEPIFPRKIMTKDLGYQVEVFNKQEALGYFKSSRYEDCRINAYPSFTEYEEVTRKGIKQNTREYQKRNYWWSSNSSMDW